MRAPFPRRSLRLVGCLLSLLPLALRAEVRLPAIFSEHVVLMKAAAVPVWGKADPGEHIRVTIGGKTAEADAGANGRWQAVLNLEDSAPGPFEMTVEGKNRIVIPDAVVGEVWLASGQSNMELPLRVTTGADAEIAQSANSFLRQFLVKAGGANQPAEECQGRWTVAAPETSGEFTAVGYYFGKELQQRLKVPVAIIHASQGGTYIEPWTPVDALERIESFQAPIAALRQSAEEYPIQKAKFATDFTAWLKKYGREDQPCPNPALYADESAPTSDWATVTFPGKVSEKGFAASGVFWIRHEIDVSALLAHQGFKIMVGPLDGYWQVYWNGKKLNETTYAQLPGKNFACYFPVPPEQIRAGKNTLAIRIYSPTAPLAVLGRSMWAGPIDLNGPWLAKVERALPDLSPGEASSAPQMTYQLPEMQPGSLYNARIHPLIRYAIAGVLWYQGESNVKRAFQYRVAFPALIKSWREKWQGDDLPFYFCQVCNNNPKLSAPAESAWAELRESQSLALTLPHTGQAVTIDLGEAGDLHARDKKTVGHRLFLLAEAEHYGQPGASSGPVYDSVAIEAGKARIKFRSADGKLVAGKLSATYNVKTLTGETAPLIRNSPHSELEGFAICGEDHKWVWAEAKIDGDTVLAWSDKVPQPVAVRYGWADNPTCNLYNAAGLPASPFRTDDFPATTANAHF
ncbi:MAG: sialate O-acetylesterase [Chthoniobacter sp.]|nr:sialate O-acetylesterase [Chthoniobacter sp.]